ncbi:esterase/lipase family protein [Streptomyces xanthophaeus]|uniref:esterase/lipase family protein n=1 Tax=Streptomyces xanthophaeus TaxID=67385 RepID=UPI003990361E
MAEQRGGPTGPNPGRLPFHDVLVLVPGITGSTLLDWEGNEIWGQSGSALYHGLLRGGARRLQLPCGLGDAEPEDGIQPGRLMPGVHASLGAWSTSLGYGRLIRHLTNRYTLTAADPRAPEHTANLLPFPYDWRLSNRYNGRLLKRTAEPILERWRSSRPERRDARLVILANSMGGLVARWYAEQEGGAPLLRALITVGTPHRGSAKAVGRLVNGLVLGRGRLRLDLSPLLRSLPALHQLLPGYASVHGGDRMLTFAEAGGLRHVSRRALCDADEFHRTLGTPKGYPLYPLVGTDQPTCSSVSLDGCRATPLRTMVDASGASASPLGDGTVPRFAAYPPGWSDRDPSLHFIAQSHGALPSHPSVLDHVDGILDGTDTEYRTHGFQLGIDVDDCAFAGEPLRVRAETSDPAIRLAVHVVNPATRRRVARVDMTRAGDLMYSATVEGLGPGGYEVRVGRAHPQGFLTNTVVGATMVIDPADGGGPDGPGAVAAFAVGEGQ